MVAIAILLLSFVVTAVAQNQMPLENRAFQRAMDAFTDGHFERAERAFADFVLMYPTSPFVTEATLQQAQSALSQSNAVRAISIINAGLSRAGLLQDQYRYCLGNAYLQSGNFLAAAEAFSAIPRAMTNSSLLLEASYGEALARFRLGRYAEVTALLQDPAGYFQRAIRTRGSDRFSTRGRMLLAEALYRQNQFKPAAEELQALPADQLLPDVRWEREYLLCRLMVAERRYADALAGTTNLLTSAAAADSRTSLAVSYFFQASLLRQMGLLDEAAIVYTNNLAEPAPPEHRRLALLNIIELKLAQDKTTEAVAMLDSFLARHPTDAVSDLVQLTRGELELKMYLSDRSTNGPVDSSLPGPLASALNRFETLLSSNVSEVVRGKALLDKGWCFWLGQKIPESSAAFRTALQALPFSEDQAVARFKLGDAYFAQQDYTNAIAHYRALTNAYVSLPSVRSTLFDQALYQILHACVALGDEAGAMATMRALLQTYADSSFADRSLFLVGQELMKRAKPKESRACFLEFVERYPKSALRAEVELVVARTFVQEGLYNDAVQRYEKWLTDYPGHPLRSRAEFNRAWATDKAGQNTNALALFVNFVAEFQMDTNLAPKAQYWIGDHYLRLGLYREAIGSFQKILENTNWPTTRLTYEARFKAGYSAYFAQLWQDAAGGNGHFSILSGDESCPPNLRAEAYFAYADTLVGWATQLRAVEKFKEAKDAFSRIPLFFPKSPIVPAAWGRIGDCYLQMASQDSKQYAEATNAYLRAMTNLTADIDVRSQAEYGLAKALERYGATLVNPAEMVAFQKAAFDHYYRILIGDNVRDNEYPSPFWVGNAGQEAGRLAEELKQWSLAISIYQRLQKILEPLRPKLEPRIRRIQEIQRRDQL